MTQPAVPADTTTATPNAITTFVTQPASTVDVSKAVQQGIQDHVDTNGFPPNTPVAEMTDKQQAAYWKHHSRKHEDTVKSLGNIDELRQKAAERDKLVEAARTEQERAVETAKAEALEQGRKEARAATMPQIVRAELRAAAAGRIEPARLTALIDPLDMSKFLTEAGEVDTDKVTTFVHSQAGSGSGTAGNGSPGLGQGNRGGGADKPSVETGAALFASRKKSPTSTT